jgi:hypothetical protein
MTSKHSREKKLVYIPNDLLDEVAKYSKTRGVTISRFIEEAVEQAVKVSGAGYDLEQLGEFFEVMYSQRVLGGAFMPMDVLTYLTNVASKDGMERLGTVWFDSGRWHGRYLKEKYPDPVRALKIFLEASRWDLSEVEVKSEGIRAKIRCVSTVLTSEATEALSRYIAGMMDGIGYEVEKNDFLKGMILLQFKQKAVLP